MKVLLCPMSDPGYLYPAIAIGLALRRRGTCVYALGGPGAEAPLAEAGLPYAPAQAYGARRSFNVTRWSRETPGQYVAIRQAAREVGADVLVTSVLCHGALLAAETLDLPVVVIGFAAHLWEYSRRDHAERRASMRAWRTASMLRLYNSSREQIGLVARPADRGYPLIGDALLLRGDPAMEEPGATVPERVHHVGPCTWEPVPDPAEVDEVRGGLERVAKPVAYVHLGRVFGGTSPWPRLAAAFTGGPFQAVVELGRSGDPPPVPDADLVVIRKPWMAPLLDRAEFVLTSGTSAPVLNALLRGHPIGVSPAGSEQPLLAAACVRAGVAAHISEDLSHDPVRVLCAAWRDSGMRIRARKLGERLAAAGGAERAADVIQAVSAGRLVTGPR